MLKRIEDTLNKSCLIGLSYFNVQGEQLKQNILAGRVIEVDSEMGITVELSDNSLPDNGSPKDKGKHKSKAANFILPTDLSCWFNAPKGEFHTSQKGIKIVNPDYLVTWDVYQTKQKQDESSTLDSEQQWWQWQPRTQSPNVG